MAKNSKRKNAARVIAAAGMAVAMNSANAIFVVDGPEGFGDFVWNDLNQNGIQDAGEPGIDGVDVTLWDDTGTVFMDSTTTAGGGFYFLSAPPFLFSSYVLEFALPAGFAFTLQDIGLNDAIDSDVNPGTGRTGLVLVDFGENLTVDAGMFELVDRTVPEPGVMALLGFGIAGLGWAQRRRRQAR